MVIQVGCSSKVTRTQLSSFGRSGIRRQSAWSGRQRHVVGTRWQSLPEAARTMVVLSHSNSSSQVLVRWTKSCLLYQFAAKEEQ